MGKSFNTAVSLTAAIVNHSKRKKAIKEISKANTENRNVIQLGSVCEDRLIPNNTQMGNICISGGAEDVRNRLVIQNCHQNISIGIPTIIIHEGNHRLEYLFRHEFSNYSFMRVINSSSPYYEPVYRLDNHELSNLIMNAALSEMKMDASAQVYIKAVASLLRAKGIIPYLRMMETCPYTNLPMVIDQLESSGRLTVAEADSIRNDIISCSGARPVVECFFSQLQQEADILAWKSNLSKSTSIMECTKRNGLMIIDITSCSRRLLLSLINAELIRNAQLGRPFRIIVDGVSLKESDPLWNTLKSVTGAVAWTITCPDIYRFIGSKDGELASWLAMTHRTIIMSHGLQSSQKIAAEIGDYEYIDVAEAHAGNHNMGQFGYHFGTNTNISTSKRREPIFRSENIENLPDDSFILIDNFNSCIGEGRII